MIKSFEFKVLAVLGAFIIAYVLSVLLLNFTTDIHLNDTYYIFSKQNFLIAITILILFFYFFLHAILQVSFRYSSIRWVAVSVILLSLIVCSLFGYSLFRGSVFHHGYRPVLPKDYTDFGLLISPILVIMAIHLFKISQIISLKNNGPA
jgi:glucan phosphoethanolaminetransferase (alkaline phosphatase superfamily)